MFIRALYWFMWIWVMALVVVVAMTWAGAS